MGKNPTQPQSWNPHTSFTSEVLVLSPGSNPLSPASAIKTWSWLIPLLTKLPWNGRFRWTGRSLTKLVIENPKKWVLKDGDYIGSLVSSETNSEFAPEKWMVGIRWCPKTSAFRSPHKDWQIRVHIVCLQDIYIDLEEVATWWLNLGCKVVFLLSVKSNFPFKNAPNKGGWTVNHFIPFLMAFPFFWWPALRCPTRMPTCPCQ